MIDIAIPNNWKLKRLFEVSIKQISYGIVQTGENIEKGIYCVRVVDLSASDIDVTQMIKTTDKINQSYKKTILEEGEIMLALRGVIGLVKIVDKQLIGCNLTRGIARISPDKKKVSSEFLFWIIQSSLSRKDLLRRVNGSALKEIPISELRKTLVLLPPLEEQKKIAEILSTWDKAIALTEKLIAAKQKLKKGLMQRLFKSEYKDKTWKKGKLKDFIASLDAGVSVNSVDQCIEDNEIGILKTSSVTYGIFLPHEHKAVIAQERNLVTVSPKKDRIIISRMNTPKLVGASVYIDQDYSHLFLPDRLWQIEPKSNNFSMKWLSYFLSLDNTRFYISCLATGTSNSMKNISKKSLLNLKISMPSIERQKSIVSLLSSIDSEVKNYKKVLDREKKQKRGLMQKLLTGEWRVNTEKTLEETES